MQEKTERLRNFLITSQFIASAYELPKEYGRIIFKALRLFLTNPRHPSLNFEKLDGSRTGMLASIRIDQGHRIILSGGPTATLLYVGTHEEAYQFAKRSARPNENTIIVHEEVESFSQFVILGDVTSSVFPSHMPNRVSVERLENLIVRTRKYLPLARFLADFAINRTTIAVSFREIEAMLGDPLPKSARAYNAWWANDNSHIQANSWLALGWQTSELDLLAEKVTFVRRFGK